MALIDNMNAPTDLCYDKGEEGRHDICQVQKDDTSSFDFSTGFSEDPHLIRRSRPLSELLASLRQPTAIMQSYRLSMQMLADMGIGLEEGFQDWLNLSDEALQDSSSIAAQTNIGAQSATKKDPHNPLLFALANPKKNLRLPLDDTSNGSFSSNDETEACMASSSIHGDSPRKDAFRLRDQDQGWTSNPFNNELNMIETMIAEDRIAKLPPSAATAGWTQGAEKRESAHHYAKIQVPHRSSKAPKIRFEAEESSEELDSFLGDFDYSQFHQPPARPSLPLKDITAPRRDSNAGPIVIKSSRETISPRAKVETFTANTGSQQDRSTKAAPLKPLPTFSDAKSKTSMPDQGEDVAKGVYEVQHLPSHPLSKPTELTSAIASDVNDVVQVEDMVVKSEDSIDTTVKTLPHLPPLVSSTKMPGSWASSESLPSLTLSEPTESESKGMGFGRLKEAMSSTISFAYSKKTPTLQKKKSLGNLFGIVGKHGLRKEKDYSFKSRSKMARESIIMPSISLQKHFETRNVPVIVMKNRAPVSKAKMLPTVPVDGESISLQAHFESRHTPVIVMRAPPNSKVPQSDQNSATYPRKVTRKPSIRH